MERFAHGFAISQKRKLVVKSLVVAVLASVLVLIGVWVIRQIRPTHALVNHSDNNGSYILTFEDMSGLTDEANVKVGSGLVALADPSESGSFITSDIAPSSSGGWKNLKVEGAWGHPEAIKVQLLDCSNVPLATPVGNVSGLTLSGLGEVDLASVPVTQSCLRVKVTLDNAQGGNPSLSKLTVSWQPKTVYLIRASTVESVQAGQTAVYKIDYSVSYSDDYGTVIYAPLPSAAPGSYTPGYGQDLDLSFSSATNGGYYTATAVTVNGVEVPANSVYWSLGDQTAGSAGSVTFEVRTKNGWENGVRYSAVATIVSQATSPKTSAPAEFQVTSIPRPALEKRTGNTISIGDTVYAYDGNPYNGRVNYSIVYNNRVSGSSVGMEALFEPVITDDLSDIIDLMTKECAEANPVDRISNISDNGVIVGNTIVWRPDGTIEPLASRTVSFTVDYSGCGSGEVVTNTASADSANTDPVTAAVDVRLFDVPLFDGNVAKGENGSIRGLYNDYAPDADPTSMAGKVPYGGTTTYNLLVKNTALLKLGDIVMQDMIPTGMEFVSASLPTGINGKIYYYTGTDYIDAENAPVFDYKNPLSNGWSEIVPGNPADVRWVTMYVPCLQPGVFAGLDDNGCEDKPSSVIGNITVRVLTPADPGQLCQATDYDNVGIFNVFSTGAGVDRPAAFVELDEPLSLNDHEATRAVSPLPVLGSRTNMSGPTTIEVGDVAVYDITLSNSSSTTPTDDSTRLEIFIPNVQVGNTTRPLEYFGLTGGVVRTVNRDGNGNVTSLVIEPEVLAANPAEYFFRNLTMSAMCPLGQEPSPKRSGYILSSKFSKELWFSGVFSPSIARASFFSSSLKQMHIPDSVKPLPPHLSQTTRSSR